MLRLAWADLKTTGDSAWGKMDGYMGEELGMVADACNSSVQEAEAGG